MYQARRKHNPYRRKALQEAKKLVKRVREELHPVVVFLFGSVARGDAHALSDIDLLIVADFPRDLETKKVVITLTTFHEELAVSLIQDEGHDRRAATGQPAKPLRSLSLVPGLSGQR